LFLLTHGRGRTVTGVHDGLGRERQDFFSDSIEKNFTTASWEVPTANAIGKKNVTPKELTLLGKVKAEATGAVAGDMKKAGRRPVRGKRGFFVQKLGGVYGAEFFWEAEGEHGIGLEAEKRGVGMIVNGAFSPLGEVGRVPDMVPVSMGEKEGVRFDVSLFEKIEKSLRGIDGEEMALEIKEVGVGGGEAAGVDQRVRHKGS
jgi:hypothetical protein